MLRKTGHFTCHEHPQFFCAPVNFINNQPRRRRQSRQDVARALSELVDELGYDRVTHAAISKRSGWSKTQVKTVLEELEAAGLWQIKEKKRRRCFNAPNRYIRRIVNNDAASRGG